MSNNGHDYNNTPRRINRKISEQENNAGAQKEPLAENLSELDSLLNSGQAALEKNGEKQKVEEQNVWNLMDEKPIDDLAQSHIFSKLSGTSALKSEDEAYVPQKVRVAAYGKAKKRKKIKHPVLTTIIILFALFVLVFAALTAFLLYSTRNDYLWLNLEQIPYRTQTVIYSTSMANGQTEEYFAVNCTQNKIYCPPEEIPQNLLNAFVAVEDRKFESHHGVDVKRTGFAIVNEFAHKLTGKYIGGDSGRKQGASTINQQLIKNLTGDDEDSEMAGYLRKIKEMYRAWAMDYKYSKEEILHAYVNTISFTGNTAGVGAEAKKLFGKTPNQLTLAECAGLAGITRSPARYNPVKNPEEYIERRNYVLSCMLEEEFITQGEYEQAVSEALALNYSGEPQLEQETTSYFTDMLIENLVSELAEALGLERSEVINLYYNGGLRIYSTVDSALQSSMEHALATGVYFGADKQAAMISLDYEGAVKGVVGGVGKKEVSLGFNRAVGAKRQVGSTMKPIGPYALALEEGKINWSSMFLDAPVRNETDEDGQLKEWPANASKTYTEQQQSVYYAFAKSLNTVAVRVGQLVGEEAVFNFVTKKLGVTSLVEEDKSEGPMFLGSSTHGISPVEMAMAYAMFGNGGKTPDKYYCFTHITDGQGKIIYETKHKSSRSISEENAYIMNRMMKEVFNIGTVPGLQAGGQMESVGKTGTTNDRRDYWFMGLTPYYVTAVWYGADDGGTVGGGGQTPPTVLAWRNVMNEAQANLPYKEFEVPSSVQQKSFCSATGLMAGENCPKLTGWYAKADKTAVCGGNH